MQRVLEGFTNPFKGKSPRRLLEVTIGLLIMVVSSGFMGYTYGYYDATGFPPKFLMQKSQVILPPEVTPVVTSKQVEDFVLDEKIDLNKYETGFNSTEFALLLARQAHWKGLPAEAIRLDFVGTDIGHIILAFPTTDREWVFVDPTSSAIIKPNIGVKLGDKEIADMWILRAGWEPFRLEFKAK